MNVNKNGGGYTISNGSHSVFISENGDMNLTELANQFNVQIPRRQSVNIKNAIILSGDYKSLNNFLFEANEAFITEKNSFKLKNENKKLQSLLQEASEEIVSDDNDYQSIEEKANKLENEINELVNQLELSEGNNQYLQEEIEKKTDEWMKLNDEHNKLKTNYEGLNAEHDMLKTNYEDLKKNSDDANAVNKTLTDNLAAEKQKNEELKTKYRNEIKELQTENNKLNKQADYWEGVKTANEGLRKMNETLHDVNVKLNDENETLHYNVDEISGIIKSDLKASRIMDINDIFKKNVSDKNVKEDIADFLSFFKKSVPIYIRYESGGLNRILKFESTTVVKNNNIILSYDIYNSVTNDGKIPTNKTSKLTINLTREFAKLTVSGILYEGEATSGKMYLIVPWIDKVELPITGVGTIPYGGCQITHLPFIPDCIDTDSIENQLKLIHLDLIQTNPISTVDELMDTKSVPHFKYSLHLSKDSDLSALYKFTPQIMTVYDCKGGVSRTVKDGIFSTKELKDDYEYFIMTDKSYGIKRVPAIKVVTVDNGYMNAVKDFCEKKCKASGICEYGYFKHYDIDTVINNIKDDKSAFQVMNNILYSYCLYWRTTSKADTMKPYPLKINLSKIEIDNLKILMRPSTINSIKNKVLYDVLHLTSSDKSVIEEYLINPDSITSITNDFNNYFKGGGSLSTDEIELYFDKLMNGLIIFLAIVTMIVLIIYCVQSYNITKNKKSYTKQHSFY